MIARPLRYFACTSQWRDGGNWTRDIRSACRPGQDIHVFPHHIADGTVAKLLKRRELDKDQTEAWLRELVANVLDAPGAAGRSCGAAATIWPQNLSEFGWTALIVVVHLLSYDTNWESCDDLAISSTNREMPRRDCARLIHGTGFCEKSNGKIFKWHS